MSRPARDFLLFLGYILSCLSICLTNISPIINKNYIEEISEAIESNVSPVGDEDDWWIFPEPEPYTIYQAPSINWSKFWNVFKNHASGSLEAFNPVSEEWVDATSLLNINRNYTSDNTCKISFNFTTPDNGMSLDWRLTLAVDYQVKQYINNSGNHSYTLTYEAYNNTFNVEFNWSDMLQYSGLIFKHGITNIDGKDYFWFRVRRNSIPPGYYVELDPIYDVYTGSADLYNDYNSARKLIRCSNGTYCTAFEIDSDIYISWSEDSGVKWDTIKVDDIVVDGNPTICVDSNDTVHLVYAYSYSELDYANSSSGWSNSAMSGRIGDRQFYPSIAVDSSDDLHLVYERDDTDSQVIYGKSTNNGDSWSFQTLTTEADGTDDMWYPSIAINSSDSIHVVFMNEDGSPSNRDAIYHMQSDDGGDSWTSFRGDPVLESTDNEQFPCIVIDDDDNIYVAGTDTLHDCYVRYNGSADNGWSNPNGVNEEINSNAYYPSLSIQDNNTAYCSFSYSTVIFCYVNYTDYWHTSQPILDPSVNIISPSFVCSQYPVIGGIKTNRPKTGYAFTYANVTDYVLMFYASSDLTWDTGGTPSNNRPSMSNENPTNNSVDVLPFPLLNVTVSDTDDDIINATWWSNSSGSWELFNNNDSVSSGVSIDFNNENFSCHGVKYWWSVNVSDGEGGWNNETYHFTIYSPVNTFGDNQTYGFVYDLNDRQVGSQYIVPYNCVINNITVHLTDPSPAEKFKCAMYWYNGTQEFIDETEERTGLSGNNWYTFEFGQGSAKPTQSENDIVIICVASDNNCNVGRSNDGTQNLMRADNVYENGFLDNWVNDANSSGYNVSIFARYTRVRLPVLRFSYYFIGGNISSDELRFSHYFIGNNVSSDEERFSYYFIGGNISSDELRFSHYFTGNNISEDTERFSHYFIGTNISEDTERFSYYFTGGNTSATKTPTERFSYYFIGNNISEYTERFSHYFIGNNVSSDEERFSHYFTGGNISEDTERSSYYFTGGNISSDELRFSHYFLGGNESEGGWTRRFNYFFTGGNISSDEERFSHYFIGNNVSSDELRFSHYFTGGNISEDTERFSYWFTGGNESISEWNQRFSYYFTGNNISEDTERFSYYFTGGNILSYVKRDDYYFTGGNISEDTERFSYYFTGGNTSSGSIIGIPDPANGSIVYSNTVTWSILINNTFGIFNWTIECSNGQNNSADNDNEGIKNINLINLEYQTHIIWLNITDPSGTEHYWFTFICIPNLNCDFTYKIKSNMLILHPIITGETDYKWEISNQSQITGITDWIDTEDKKDYIYFPLVRETLWVRLWTRNTDLGFSCTRVQKVEMFKSTPKDKNDYIERTRSDSQSDEEPKYKTDNFFKKIGWDMQDTATLIGVILALVIILLIIFIKYPRDKWYFPVKKNRGKK